MGQSRSISVKSTLMILCSLDFIAGYVQVMKYSYKLTQVFLSLFIFEEKEKFSTPRFFHL